MGWSREEVLFDLFDSRGRGLEIGPSHNPLTPKFRGFNVEVLDYTDREGLIAKYQDNPHVDLSRIEEVDHVTLGRPIRDVIGERGCYDFIIASHVIEHLPDMLDFLQTCGDLLQPSGVLVLVVPDKRFCYDLLLPPSTTGEVLQAHHERRRRPLPGAIFNSIAYDVLRAGRLTWDEETAESPEFNATLQAAHAFFKHAASTEEYTDVHVWRFTPSGFRLIIEDLYALGASPMREAHFVTTNGAEFYATLSLGGGGPGCSRIGLAIDALRELAQVRL
jgi:predicted SAM-dependent methyltransferase